MAAPWESLAPRGVEEIQRARTEELAWLPVLADLRYTPRFLSDWLLDEPTLIVDLVRSHAGIHRCGMAGWPGDTLPADQGQDFLYRWAQGLLAALSEQSQDVREGMLTALVTLLSRPHGTDGLWPGQALRRP